MTTEVTQKRGIQKILPALFLVILICFLLPFVDVTRYRLSVASFTGSELITSTAAEKPDLGTESLTVLVLVCAIAGLGLSFLPGRETAIAPASSGSLGLILMLFLKLKLDNYAQSAVKEGGGMVRVEYEMGFWVVVLLFVAAVGLNASVFFEDRCAKKASDD